MLFALEFLAVITGAKPVDRIAAQILAERLGLVPEPKLALLFIGYVRDGRINADVIAIESDYGFGDHNSVLH